MFLFPHSPINNWNHTTLSQVDRFLLFLPDNRLQEIPLVCIPVPNLFDVLKSIVKRWDCYLILAG